MDPLKSELVQLDGLKGLFFEQVAYSGEVEQPFPANVNTLILNAAHVISFLTRLFRLGQLTSPLPHRFSFSDSR